MIRRKIWATATCCLALAAAARAQTGSTPAANPQSPGYIARGAAPTPGPRFVPRTYTAPSTPTYGTQPAAPVVAPADAAVPAESFAIETDSSSLLPPPATPTVAPGSPTPGATLVPMPSPAPATGPAPGPAPMVDVTVQTPAPMPMGGVYGGPAMAAPMMTGPALNGGPILDPTYLGGMGGCGMGDGPNPCVWGTAEYINWRLKSVSVPPLVTTAPAGSFGALLDPNTSVAYGDSHLQENWQSGFRIRGGMWFPDGSCGLDIAFFYIDVTTDRNSFASNGGQGLFKPFFNTAIRAEDAQLVAFSGPNGPLLAGTVTAVSQASLWGAEANIRAGWGMGLGGRIDALVGGRYIQLHDRLTLDSRSTTLAAVGTAPAGTMITSSDRFDALNQFYGAQVGFAGEWQIGMMSFGLRGTIAGGWTTQAVDINGATSSLTPAGASLTVPGGLFAQSTNIGNFSRSRFSVVPEIGVTLGYQCTNNIRIFGGYNVLCWTNTVRAGEQINRQVNGTFIPDPVTGAAAQVGAPGPWFHHRDENFWVQGYSVGVEFRW